MQLYLDCDGVLANFDKHGTKLLGMLPRHFKEHFGEQEMWDQIKAKDPNFWLNLELMPDAMLLYDTVKHLDPIILTGVPKELEENKNNQKYAWAEKYFGGVKVICCRVSRKADYCNEGDVLVDDRIISFKKWTKAGGKFILHKNALDSIEELKILGVI